MSKEENKETIEKEEVSKTEEKTKKENKPKKEDKKSEKIKELENKVKELEDKILRDRAELINFRKRKEEEMARNFKYANEGLVKEILPLLDNFERAIDMDDDILDDEVSKFLRGFVMIHDSFKNALENFGLKEINGINKPFDPIYHEAMMKEKKEDTEENIVIEILQKGYLFNDKVIRPAMVKVSE